MLATLLTPSGPAPEISFANKAYCDPRTGHFRTAYEQKNKDEAERANLHFPLFVQWKLQTGPLSRVSVLLYLHNSKTAY